MLSVIGGRGGIDVILSEPSFFFFTHFFISICALCFVVVVRRFFSVLGSCTLCSSFLTSVNFFSFAFLVRACCPLLVYRAGFFCLFFFLFFDDKVLAVAGLDRLDKIN